jgi:peptidoglycan/LPS O-acetylase OafA/YrhL
MSRAGATSSRVTFLDGLRGIAAFVVIVSHLIAGFFPALYFGAQGRTDAALMDAIATSPLFVTYSGTFAVYIFFVLSGFVIAASAAKTACRLPVLVLTRYLRLAVPVGLSICFAFALVNVFPGAPQRAAQVVGNWWLDLIYRPFNLTFGFALREAFVNVYWTGLSYYNNVLWTMRIELAGSVAIYAFYQFIGRSVRVPALVLAAMLACFATRAWPSDLLGFFLGALIYEARTRDKLAQKGFVGAGLLVVGIFLGGLPFAPGEGTFYQAIFSFVDRVSPAFGTVRVMGAAALILGIFMWKESRILLDSLPAQFLGRISFSLYLVHLPLLCVGFSELYVRFGQIGAVPMALAIGCYIAAAIGAAYVFTVLVDEPTVGMLARWKKAWSARPARPISG